MKIGGGISLLFVALLLAGCNEVSREKLTASLEQTEDAPRSSPEQQTSVDDIDSLVNEIVAEIGKHPAYLVSPRIVANPEILADQDEGGADMSIIERVRKEGGGPTVLAKKLGVTSSAISQWKQVPEIRVEQIEKITGIPRHELRPDLYPAPEARELAPQS